MEAYVDGSFRSKKKNGYGVILSDKGYIIYKEKGSPALYDDKKTKTDSVKTELVAALRAVEKAIELNQEKITLIYDCKAIIDLLNVKKTKNSFGRIYKNLIKRYSENINIEFKHKTKYDKIHKQVHKLSRFYLN